MKFIIVTGGDEAYAPFVADLAQSLTRLKSQTQFATGCLDYGVAPRTREALSKAFEHIVAPEWPSRPNAQFDKQIQARAFATRPFLPDYFPGFDAYAWIDADAGAKPARDRLACRGKRGRACAPRQRPCHLPTDVRRRAHRHPRGARTNRMN